MPVYIYLCSRLLNTARFTAIEALLETVKQEILWMHEKGITGKITIEVKK